MINTAMNGATRVLIIEDEADLLDAKLSFLKLDGFTVHGVGSLREADHWLLSHTHDILVLDLGLPDGDGLAWLAARSDLVHQGVIITTARGESPARVSGARAGADAYLVKPVQLEELSALIGNLMRRRQQVAPQVWQLNVLNWTLKSPLGVSAKLTSSELKLMKMFTTCPGHVVTRHALVVGLGHDPDVYDPRRLEILIRRFRSKAKTFFGPHFPLDTAHGEGYSFTAAISMG